MIPRVMVAGIAVGDSPTSIARRIMATECPYCTAVEVFRSQSLAMSKRAPLRRLLSRSGMVGHVCGAQS